MKWHVWLALIICLVAQRAHAQEVGEVTTVSLSGGGATLTLDFSDRDYELILYSAAAGVTDTARTFAYTVTAGTSSTKPLATSVDRTSRPGNQDRLDLQLRREEQELAIRLRSRGGWRPPLRKAADFADIGSVRSFVFDAYGQVASDRTVAATLVASTNHALGYLDNALAESDDNVTESDIGGILDQFSDSTYTTVTAAFGEPSDVDGNGKVIFLFTHLVDQVGGTAGFYASRSLFETGIGGNGNIADMMFISPTRAPASYESLLAHEFQHLVSFNQHAVVRSGEAEDAWLNEALSHYTEDLVNGHIAGSNPSRVHEFLDAPEQYSLTGDASFNAGIRGAAYLFLQGLVDQLGEGVLGQLVQTDRTGISNVEAVTGEQIEDLLRTFAARLFLSGNGLNTAAGYNYAFEYFTESTTGYRSIPPPLDSRLAVEGASASGALKPMSVSYIRLTASGSGLPVTVQADVSGEVEGLLIPLPKSFLPRLSLPVDYFSGVTLTDPLPGVFVTGESVEFSGTVLDSSVTRLLLTLEPRRGSGQELEFQFDVSGGSFSRSIVFAAPQAGEYTLGLFAGQQGELLPSVGGFPGVVITGGTGPVNLPVDFFPGITLSTPLPTQYTAGIGASLSGTVEDPTIEVVQLIFVPDGGGTPVVVPTYAADGTFRKGFVFLPDQAGTYSLIVYGGPRASETIPSIGTFSPVTVSSTGSERVYLPVDLFESILLDAPLAADFLVGREETLSGRVTDFGITRLAVSFVPASGGPAIDFVVGITDGKFSTDLAFTTPQVGTYEIQIYGGQAGQSLLPYLGGFTPASVLPAQPDILVRQSGLDWQDVTVGEGEALGLTVVNVGSQGLEVTSIAPDSAIFSVEPTVLSIPPGDSSSVTVTFTSGAAGAVTGSLRITSNDPDEDAVVVTLTGTGVAPEPTEPTADFTGDGKVNFLDFLAFAKAFGTREGDTDYEAGFDLTGDDQVDFLDFLRFAGAFGKPV